jgi:prophage regulatory protein
MLYRPPRSRAELGTSNTQFYEDIAKGLITKPIKIGLRASAHPAHEIEAIARARSAGLSADEIKKLVDKLHAQRATLAAEIRAEIQQPERAL